MIVVISLLDDIPIMTIAYDNTPVSRTPGTPLTTVDIHGEELGRQAATAAARRLLDPEAAPVNLVSTPTLVGRATTGPVS